MSAATELHKDAEAIANAAPRVLVEHPSIAAALVEALADLTVVNAARTADAGSYRYNYADIADVVRLTRPVLAKHGLVALTPVHDHGDGLACTVTLIHVTGERLDLGPFPFPHGRDAQATGSMVTYHRRYALVAALGMAAGDDDDGAAAAPRVDDRDAATPAVTAADAKKRLLELLDGDTDAASAAWEAAGLKGKRYLSQTEVDGLFESVAPFEEGS